MFNNKNELAIYLLRCSATPSENHRQFTVEEFKELAQRGLSVENVACTLVSIGLMEKCDAPPHSVRITKRGIKFLNEIDCGIVCSRAS